MAFDLICDVRAAKNRDVYFEPTGNNLQSDWRESESRSAPEVIRDLGEIPGQQIRVDTKGRKALIHHKMNDPENKELDQRVRRAFASEQGGFVQFTHYTPDENINLELDDDYATFLYWLRRLADTHKIVVIKGELPTLDQMRRLGNVRVCSGSSGYGIQPLPGKPSLDHLPRITGDVKDLAAKV